MKKLSYMLASVVSAVAALASSAATARTAEPHANLVDEPSAATIAVSESAKRKIGTQAIEDKARFALKLKPNEEPSFGDSKFKDTFKDKPNKRKSKPK